MDAIRLIRVFSRWSMLSAKKIGHPLWTWNRVSADIGIA